MPAPVALCQQRGVVAMLRRAVLCRANVCARWGKWYGLSLLLAGFEVAPSRVSHALRTFSYACLCMQLLFLCLLVQLMFA